MPTHTLEQHLVGPMLRRQAGRQIECPGCGAILDAGRAVSLELIRGENRVATRMVCADCADGGAIRRAYRAGRSRAADFRLRTIDGRLLDANDWYHPPEELYGLGLRDDFETAHVTGLVRVRGVRVWVREPPHAAREFWFAYGCPVPGSGRTWHLVHEETGFSAGRSRSLRGCLHDALAKFLRLPVEQFEKALRQARRRSGSPIPRGRAPRSSRRAGRPESRAGRPDSGR